MFLDPSQIVLGLCSGVLVGFTLGMFGGGGSVLAVPLMVYIVGVRDPHIAIGTSAFAVAVNAGVNLISYAKSRQVIWSCAAAFSASGVLGAFGGSLVGKAIDGSRLLAYFALLMMGVASIMFFRRNSGSPADAQRRPRCTAEHAPKILSYGLAMGAFSGFFGIGGGFLIVPALMAATGMPIFLAVGSSLVAVTVFGMTTAASYVVSGLVDWSLALTFVCGGIGGGMLGRTGAKALSERKGALNVAFSAAIFAVGVYMLMRTLMTPSV